MLKGQFLLLAILAIMYASCFVIGPVLLVKTCAPVVRVEEID